jgi:dipeptidyl aminopeptidase/acylaminoacyl peptidase
MRERVCARYVARGFVAVNVEYRGGLPAAADDARTALLWFTERAAQYGADAKRIVVTGESAGGHLALWAAFAPGKPVAAVVNFYGVSDVESLLDFPPVQEALPGDNRREAARSLSPLAIVTGKVCPVLSIHGTGDPKVPVDQTTRLTRRIREFGGDAEEVLISGGGHGFSDRQLATAYNAVFAFLRRHGIVG